jgi:hypothetical protein
MSKRMSHSGSAAACPADAGGFDPLHARHFGEKGAAARPSPSLFHKGRGDRDCPWVAGATPMVLTSGDAVRFRAWAPHQAGCGPAAKLPPSEGGDREFESRHPDHFTRFAQRPVQRPHMPPFRGFESLTGYGRVAFWECAGATSQSRSVRFASRPPPYAALRFGRGAPPFKRERHGSTPARGTNEHIGPSAGTEAALRTLPRRVRFLHGPPFHALADGHGAGFARAGCGGSIPPGRPNAGLVSPGASLRLLSG